MPYMGNTTRKASDIRRFDVTSSTSATHTLTWIAPNEQSLIVTINGVKQHEDSYSTSGAVLTLTSALIATDKLEVIGINDIGTTITPAQNSVDTDKILDDAVTAAKLANSINTEIAANTAKVTNATHTGDVTGATALTIATDAVDIAMLSATGTADATTFLRGDNAWVAPTAGLFSSYAIIADQKVGQSGTFTSGAWRTRDLNTELADPDGIVSISANQFTLAAGTYLIKWIAPAFNCSLHQTRLYNVTDTAQVEVGVCAFVNVNSVVTTSSGCARTTIAGSKAFTIEHYCATTSATAGFGQNCAFGVNDQYALVEIFKEA